MTLFRIQAVFGLFDRLAMQGINFLVFKTNTSLLILLFSFISATMSIISVSHCTFVKGAIDIRPDRSEYTVGLFSLAIFDKEHDEDFLGCVIFPDDVEFDDYFRISRIAGTFMATCMTCTFFVLVKTIVFGPTRVLWNACRLGLVLSTAASVFTFAITSSDHCTEDNCSLTGVGMMSVINSFIMAALSLILCIEPTPSNPWYIRWTEEKFLANKDTLALGGTNRPEFVSSEEIERSSQASAQTSVVSEQFSVQDSLMSIATGGLQTSAKLRFGLIGLFFLSWLLSVLGIRNCTFVMLGSEEASFATYMGVGLFSRAYYIDNEFVGCIEHSDERKEDFDPLFHVSRVFGAVAALLMSAVLLVGILQLFTNLARVETWLFVRMLLPCVLVTQGLTGLVFYSDTCNGNDATHCVPGFIGYTVMGNMVLLFVLSVFCCCLPTPANPVFSRWRPEEEDEGEDKSQPGSEAVPPMTTTKKVKSMLTTSKKSKLGVVREGHEPLEEWGMEGLTRTHEIMGDSSTTSETHSVKEVIIKVETSNGERKIIKEIIHHDGTKTLTTSIEELEDELESELVYPGAKIS